MDMGSSEGGVSRRDRAGDYSTNDLAGQGGVLRVLQITDTHLLESEGLRFRGVDPLRMLDRVLAAVQGQDWPPDLIVLTGDLVENPTRRAYLHLRGRLSALQCPVLCLPGNHDDPALMRSVLSGEGISVPGHWKSEHWMLVLLNGHQAACPSGYLPMEELERLHSLLQGNPRQHFLICLHHQPLPVGNPWLDATMLQNATELLAVLDRHRQVRGVLWGHVHQPFESHRRGVRLLACPSSCVQFRAGPTGNLIDPRPPGYRWLRLYPGGRIHTGIRWLAA